jgi:hypothetical protein
MDFSRLKKRRRGQIRAVDFVVSLFLFLLMLSQLILIIINVQNDVTESGIADITYEELDLFGRQLLEQEGDLFWGYQKNLPASFGLADSTSKIPLSISAAKIARLVTGTKFPISGMTGYDMYDYSTVKDIINLDQKHNFLIGFSPCLEVSVIVSTLNVTANMVDVLVTNYQDISISNAQVHFYTIDLTNGDAILEGIASTNSTGEASEEYLIPNINDPDSEHITFVIVRKNALWGVNWAYAKEGLPTERVTIGDESNTTIWGGGINSSSILISDSIEISDLPDNHFLSLLYEDHSSNFVNKTIDLGNSYESNETISIPNNGLVFFLSISRENNLFKVGIGSYPAILDRDSVNGIFYQVFGPINPSENVKAMLSKIYPIIVRGTLMRCQVTLWSR